MLQLVSSSLLNEPKSITSLMYSLGVESPAQLFRSPLVILVLWDRSCSRPGDVGRGWRWSTLLLLTGSKDGKPTLTHVCMHLRFEYLTRAVCWKDFFINLYPKAKNFIFLLIILSSISKGVVSHSSFIRPLKRSAVISEVCLYCKLFLSKRTLAHNYIKRIWKRHQ